MKRFEIRPLQANENKLQFTCVGARKNQSFDLNINDG